MKIVALSDTHGQHRNIKVPDGDLFIHAGDFSRLGRLSEISEFNEWLGTLTHKHKIVIAGNHDGALQDYSTAAKKAITNAIYLQDESILIDGVKVYGSPWTPAFNNWSFNVPRERLELYWDNIPNDVDVLVTHGPPLGILDNRLGCEALRSRVSQVKPKIHIFGHIHEGHGCIEVDGTQFYNVAALDGRYGLAHEATVIEL